MFPTTATAFSLFSATLSAGRLFLFMIPSLWRDRNALVLLLCSFTGRRKEERRESLPCGDLNTECEPMGSRRPSFLKIVSLGKLTRESMSDKTSQEDDEEIVEEEQVVKTREPLSGRNQGSSINSAFLCQTLFVFPLRPSQLSDYNERSRIPMPLYLFSRRL